VAQDRSLSAVVVDITEHFKKGVKTIMNLKIATRMAACVDVLLCGFYGAVAGALFAQFIKSIDWSELPSVILPVVWNKCTMIAAISGVLVGVGRVVFANRTRKARTSVPKDQRIRQFLKDLEQEYLVDMAHINEGRSITLPHQEQIDMPVTTTCGTRLSMGESVGQPEPAVAFR
jgi:hypothetical protein